MTIDLDDYEEGEAFPGDPRAAVRQLQERLGNAHAGLIAAGKPVMIVVEGPEGSGRGGLVRRIDDALDPDYARDWTMGPPNQFERERHFLWRYWLRMPGHGEVALFDGSWYERVLGLEARGMSEDTRRRVCDEINEFEAQQAGQGVVLVKLLLHLAKKEQRRRMKRAERRLWDRMARPSVMPGYDAYRAACEQMLECTHRRWAPWTVIDANDKQAGRIAALRHLVERLEAQVPNGRQAPDLKLAVNG